MPIRPTAGDIFKFGTLFEIYRRRVAFAQDVSWFSKAYAGKITLITAVCGTAVVIALPRKAPTWKSSSERR